jgi:alpha-beta hydrolase superfamily lysophospholipase
MKSENFNVASDDGTKLFVYKWLPDNSNKIKAIVHIIHGMGEHAGRYFEFAQNLTENGFAFYSMDQRGHGRTAEDPKNFGHYADKNGWRLVLNDLKMLTGIINKHYKNKDVFLFGHSAGSFLARDYLSSYQALSDKQDIRGVVLSGSTCSPGLPGHFGILLAKNIIKKHGPEAKSTIHLKLTFEKYNSYFKPNITDYDWITRDKKKV